MATNRDNDYIAPAEEDAAAHQENSAENKNGRQEENTNHSSSAGALPHKSEERKSGIIWFPLIFICLTLVSCKSVDFIDFVYCKCFNR